jgi:ribose transport system ATP-binding protein
MIYQELNLAPHLTVAENVVLGREPSRFGVIDRRRARETAQRALGRLDHADLSPDTRVGDLGPGTRQIVEIARALSGDARVVVMDEPTSSLSRADGERLFAVVRKLAVAGVTVLYVSHFLEEIRRVADRFTVLRDGSSVARGSVQETSTRELAELMTGRALEEAFPRVEHVPGESILELDALAGTPLPAGVTLSLRRGEIFGVAGLLGSGRTEMLRAVFGLAPVKAGRVRVGAAWDRGAPPWIRLDQGVGLLSEDRATEGLALGMSIGQNVVLSHAGRLSSHGFLDPDVVAARARRFIDSLGIRCPGPDSKVGALSGGNQQKVALARLLDRDVDVLLLDEPTRGVDVGSRAEIYRIVGELAARGKAILFVSSYAPELIGVCDRVAVMHRGRLGGPREANEWTEATLLEAAATGEAA